MPPRGGAKSTLVAFAVTAALALLVPAGTRADDKPRADEEPRADDEPAAGARSFWLGGDSCVRSGTCPGVGAQIEAGFPVQVCSLCDGSQGVNRFTVSDYNPLFGLAVLGSATPLAPLPHLIDGEDAAAGDCLNGCFGGNRLQLSTAFAVDAVMAQHLAAGDTLAERGYQAIPGTPAYLQMLNSRWSTALGRLENSAMRGLLAICRCTGYTDSVPLALARSATDAASPRAGALPQLIPGCTPEPAPTCDPAQLFQTITGECNNLQNPLWGRANTGLRRLLPNTYEDGLFSPRQTGHNGLPLPSARAVTAAVMRAVDDESPKLSTLLTAFGQLVTHDILHTPIARTAVGGGIQCCADGGATLPDALAHPQCLPIAVAADDPFYAQFGQRCLNFVRSVIAPDPHCRPRAARPTNVLSAYVDGTNVYGPDADTEQRLRAFVGGRMRDNGGLLPSLMPNRRRRRDVADDATSDGTSRNGTSRKFWHLPAILSHLATGPVHGHGLPGTPSRPFGCPFPKLPPPITFPDVPPLPTDDACNTGCTGCTCFDAGDSRVNEQPQLALLQTLFLREHNRVATSFAARYPSWSDEQLYQSARRFVAAEMQHIVYNEFLPSLIGYDYCARSGLLPFKTGHSPFYDPSLRADLSIEFSTAAFRHGHSQVQDLIRLSASSGAATNTLMFKGYFSPSALLDSTTFERMTRGMLDQPAEEVDIGFDRAVFGDLFRANQLFGLDLSAINVQRGRDHGIATYVDVAGLCLGVQLTTWESLLQLIPAATVQRLRSVYDSVLDVDLYVGGLAERHAPGAQVGPTFQCIIGDVFFRLRFGDRFFYDNGGMPHSLTNGQLEKVRQRTMASVLCDNIGPGFTSVQPLAFCLPDSYVNPVVECDSLAIRKPGINWP